MTKGWYWCCWKEDIREKKVFYAVDEFLRGHLERKYKKGFIWK